MQPVTFETFSRSLLVCIAIFAPVACNTEVTAQDNCGDSFLDPGEECDRDQIPFQNCQQLGYYEQDGNLGCTSKCKLDLSACSLSCGDGIISSIHGETCDGENLNGETCASRGLGAGTLACNDSCTFDISGCETQAVCGDHVVSSPFEQCEGEDLDGQTCESLGYYGGTLSCNLNCNFNLGSCQSHGQCGDNQIQDLYGEECEGANLTGRTCLTLGYHAGTLTCGTDCRLDLTDCEANGRCGDGLIQPAFSEVCDGDTGGQTCTGLGYWGGTLTCGADCRALDLSACEAAGRCGDGTVQTTYESCDGDDLGQASCRSRGWFTGPLTCQPGCVDFNETQCQDATALGVGYFHACVPLNGSGVLRCWGRNDYGQLGNGSAVHATSPVEVLNLMGVVEVAGGQLHTCARLSSGAVWCWGFNNGGQLGDNSTNNSMLPVRAGTLNNAVAVGAGYTHSCAILSDGTMRCWGRNYFGKLGDGTTTDRWVPTTVIGITGAVSTALGGDHTCAVLSDGTVKCWGRNDNGQLGLGTTTETHTPTTVTVAAATMVTAGGHHTCVRLTSGGASCWGDNTHGQLGDGTMTRRYSPVTVSGLTGAVSISAGGSHTCAVISNGTLRCWGNNANGKLGDGTTTNRLTPVQIGSFTNVSLIRGGDESTCALLDTGIVHCWGGNAFGQLGDGTYVLKLSPVEVLP